jgi:hypothetical protein
MTAGMEGVMFDRLRVRWNKRRFDWLTRDILETPPISIVDAPWSVISMVSNADVQMYLLSMKSFYTRLKRGKIVAIIDRDMPSSQRDLLRRHLTGIQFQILEDIDTGTCQRGGTWERLVYLVEHSRREFAIQLDSDTLAFGPDVDEVVRCVEANRAFTLGENDNPILTMREYAVDAQQRPPGWKRYIGIRAEALFDRYPDCDRLKYVRASSGFAGFAVGGFLLSQLEEFHRHMQELAGTEEWRKWGSEQCGSNFAVANSPDAMILPSPKYANFKPDFADKEASVLHFFGSHRYYNDYFVEKAQEVIEELRST